MTGSAANLKQKATERHGSQVDNFKRFDNYNTDSYGNSGKKNYFGN